MQNPSALSTCRGLQNGARETIKLRLVVEVEVDGEKKRRVVWKEKSKVSGRAIDLDVLALCHVYDFAQTQALIAKDCSKFVWKALADPAAKDELLSDEQMDELCNASLLEPGKLALIPAQYRHLRAAQAISGQVFHDYLRLLQHTGAREHEVSLLRWEYVTWSKDG